MDRSNSDDGRTDAELHPIRDVPHWNWPDWPSRWVRWPDWWLPTDRDDARDALIEVWQRAASQRVAVARSSGRGRTGTALACIAILDGVAPADAVPYVRQHYNPRAVEPPWQRWFVARFRPQPTPEPPGPR